MIKKLVIWIVIASGVFSLANEAHAQVKEREELARKILATGKLPCLDSASYLLGIQMAWDYPQTVLEGMRRGLGGDSKSWRQGKQPYDDLFAIIKNAVNEDVRRNGPLISISSERLLQEILDGKSIDELRYFADFFSKPAGKLYWSGTIDGAICDAWLAHVLDPPYPPLEKENKLIHEKLRSDEKSKDERFSTGYRALSYLDRQAFQDAAKKIDQNSYLDAFLRLSSLENERAVGRIMRALDPRKDEIRAILQKYR